MAGKIVESLTGIGIEVVPARLEGECFLPGLIVEGEGASGRPAAGPEGD